MNRRESLELALGAGVIRAAATLLHATYRVETVAGAEHVAALRGSGPPAILAFWHDRLLFLSGWIRREFVQRGTPVTVLISQSRDGELGTRLGRAWGAEVVRGSASRGGADALRAALRALREGRSLVLVPDGPRGPRHVLKPGIVVLAQMSGAPILPLSCAAPRAWTLRSWDRMIVPRPWSRVRVAVGAPRHVPRKLGEADLADESSAVAAELERLETRAGAARGTPLSAPTPS